MNRLFFVLIFQSVVLAVSGQSSADTIAIRRAGIIQQDFQLDSAQYRQLVKIESENIASIDKARKEAPGMSKEQRQETYARIQRAYEEQLNRILNENQKKKYRGKKEHFLKEKKEKKKQTPASNS